MSAKDSGLAKLEVGKGTDWGFRVLIVMGSLVW